MPVSDASYGVPTPAADDKCKNGTDSATMVAPLASAQPGRRLSQLYDRALATSLKEAADDHTSIEEYSLAKVKQRLLRDWHPEYEPEAFLPPRSGTGADTVSERATLIQLNDIVGSPSLLRHTKIVCTLGPACATKASMGALIDAGLNVARLNFSHGDHAAHGSTLDLFRCAAGPGGANAEHRTHCWRPSTTRTHT